MVPKVQPERPSDGRPPLPEPAPPDDCPIGHAASAIAWRIRHLRQQRGYSQEEFAEMIGVPRSTLAGVERYHQHPSIRMMVSIVTLDVRLNLDYLPFSDRLMPLPAVNPEWLLTGEGSMETHRPEDFWRRYPNAASRSRFAAEAGAEWANADDRRP